MLQRKNLFLGLSLILFITFPPYGTHTLILWCISCVRHTGAHGISAAGRLHHFFIHAAKAVATSLHFFFTLFLGCCLINHRRVLTQTRQSYERRAGLGPTLAAYLPPMKCDYQVAVGCHTPHAFPVVWLLGPWYPFSSAQPRPCHWYSVFPQSSPWPSGSAAK